jgi:hypothetical protein
VREPFHPSLLTGGRSDEEPLRSPPDPEADGLEDGLLASPQRRSVTHRAVAFLRMQGNRGEPDEAGRLHALHIDADRSGEELRGPWVHYHDFSVLVRAAPGTPPSQPHQVLLDVAPLGDETGQEPVGAAPVTTGHRGPADLDQRGRLRRRGHS